MCSIDVVDVVVVVDVVDVIDVVVNVNCLGREA